MSELKNLRPLRGDYKRSDLDRNAVTGLIIRRSQTSHEPLNLVNLSDKGLCISSKIAPKKGERITLTLSKPWTLMLACEVRWHRKDPSGDGHLIGLQVLDNLRRLEALHNILAEEHGRNQKKKAQA